MDNINNFNELIELLKNYLEFNTLPKSSLDIFVSYGLPIISSAVLIGTTIGAVIKYYSIKNKEIYENILNDVYAPLYQYFVKQELFSHIHMPDRDYKESPILSITNINTTTKINSTGINKEIERTDLLNLTRKQFIRVKDNINIGLASQELLTLLNMYEVLISMEESYSEFDKEYKEATNLKVDVENAIRYEVFMGYKKYYEKLGLTKIREVDFGELTNDQIIFKYKTNTQE